MVVEMYFLPNKETNMDFDFNWIHVDINYLPSPVELLEDHPII